ncbi:hypothetical protein A7D17_21150 [Xanthomonas floridensis]|uniref:Uncharacterized protein n=1 Tax=Xanthomonas floridensis TaxID=1843580 RepID=A0A1A9M8T2_9XANT|nr:hypothetical protein A7D17_21150 [Xanthomonas floridensis]
MKFATDGKAHFFQPATTQAYCRNALIAGGVVAITDGQLPRRARATLCALLFDQVGGVGGLNLFGGEQRGTRRFFDAPDRVAG